MEMRVGTGYKDNICQYNAATERNLKDHRDDGARGYHIFALLSSVAYVWEPEARVTVGSHPYQQMCEQNGRMSRKKQEIKRWREKCKNPIVRWRGSNPRTYCRDFSMGIFHLMIHYILMLVWQSDMLLLQPCCLNCGWCQDSRPKPQNTDTGETDGKTEVYNFYARPPLVY